MFGGTDVGRVGFHSGWDNLRQCGSSEDSMTQNLPLPPQNKFPLASFPTGKENQSITHKAGAWILAFQGSWNSGKHCWGINKPTVCLHLTGPRTHNSIISEEKIEIKPPPSPKSYCNYRQNSEPLQNCFVHTVSSPRLRGKFIIFYVFQEICSNSQKQDRVMFYGVIISFFCCTWDEISPEVTFPLTSAGL